MRVGRADGSNASAGTKAPRVGSAPVGTSARSRSSVTAKWVKAWAIVPAGCQAASIGGAPPPPVSQAVPGQPSVPPSIPRAGRRSSSQAPSARRASQSVPCRSGLGALGARRGRASAIPVRCPAQRARQGQSAQAGRRGVQIVAPRSITAWAWSPGRRSGVRAAAWARSAGRAAGSGVCTAWRRAITRSTLPSTTTAGRPKAMAATAAAV